MKKYINFSFIVALLFLFIAGNLMAADTKEQALKKPLEGHGKLIYPVDYRIKSETEDACSVRMAGDAHWAISQWLVGDEIYVTYQEPSVQGIDCSYPFTINEVLMYIQFGAPGSVTASVDILDLDPINSLPACPVPGDLLGLSEQYEYDIPQAGVYIIAIPFDEPVTVDGPYYCGMYIANDVSGMAPELITDDDPYLCVNYNDWGEGTIDLVDNPYYNFPGNLVMFSIGTSSGSGPSSFEIDFVYPNDSAVVSSNAYLRVAELSENITSSYCQFEYFNGSSWVLIYDDSNADISLRNSVFPASYREGYSANWDISSLPEGWYQVRATVYETPSSSAYDTIFVYIDKNPLKPEITNPQFESNTCDSVTLSAEVLDEDPSFMQFEYRNASRILNISPALLVQSMYGDTDNDTLDGNIYTNGEFGDFYNAPTLVASIFRYFGDMGYVNLVQEEGIYKSNREIVERLADSMRIRSNLGAEDDNFIWAVKEYLKTHGDEFRCELITTLSAEKLDYIMGYRQGAAIVALGNPLGIWLGVTEFGFPVNSDGSYNIMIYDTRTGIETVTTIKFSPYPQIYFEGSYYPFDLSMGIYPKTNPGSNNIIGMDFNPSDGFSFYWNLESIPKGSYYISANCVDAAAHTSEGITRMNLDCEQIVSGDVNGDGRIDVSDAVYLINYIFNEGPEPLPSNENGDVNCDGRLDVSDAVYLINFVFRDGGPPCN